MFDCCVSDPRFNNFVLLPIGGGCLYAGCQALNKEITLGEECNCCTCGSCDFNECYILCSPFGFACDIVSCPFRYTFYQTVKCQIQKHIKSVTVQPEMDTTIPKPRKEVTL